MWLPTDERRLLAGYYRNLGDVDIEEAFEIDELRRLLGWTVCVKRVSCYEESASPDSEKQITVKAIGEYIADEKRIRKATNHLARRGLIVQQVHGDPEVRNVLIVSLTLEGFDLGRRYSNWFDWSGLWFTEYRNHWLWLIVAFFGGAILSSVIQSLFARD